MPIPTIRVVAKAAIHIPDKIAPARNTHGGIGVPRTRFSTPSSRRMVRLIARFVYVADAAANTPRLAA